MEALVALAGVFGVEVHAGRILIARVTHVTIVDTYL